MTRSGSETEKTTPRGCGAFVVVRARPAVPAAYFARAAMDFSALSTSAVPTVPFHLL